MTSLGLLSRILLLTPLGGLFLGSGSEFERLLRAGVTRLVGGSTGTCCGSGA